MDPQIDWDTLRVAASDAAACAYAPYSHLSVGAAGLADGNRIVTGCNVENASYGLTLCAECGLVSDLYRSGATMLTAVSIVDGQGAFIWPCGRCRQLLYEVGGPDLLVDADSGPVRLATLLPHGFGPAHLPNHSQAPQ
jgi:cytidine deaminase